MAPKVSVIVMIYNSAPYLTACLESLQQQTFSDFEVLLVDDASTDDSPDICRKYANIDPRFRIIRYEENKGLSYCRAVTVEEARGEYVAILDSDDLAYPSRLEKQVSWLDANKNAVMIASYFSTIDQKGNSLNEIIKVPINDSEIRWRTAFGNCLGHSTVMYRKESALKCGGYDPKMLAGEDTEFYSRILTLGEVAVIPEDLVFYRMHDMNKHKVEPPKNRELLRAYVQQSVSRHLKKDISREVATAVLDFSLEPAVNISVFREALDLVASSPWLLRDYEGKTVVVSKALKRCALLGLMKLRRCNLQETWWKSVEKNWSFAVRNLSCREGKYFWFTDSKLFTPKRLIAKTELFPLIKALL